MTTRIIKSEFGLTFSKSYIFDRVLSVIPLLCWKPEDIGLTRVHFINGIRFKTKKSAITYAANNSIDESDITYCFDWIKELDGRDGCKREVFLRENHWPNREQVANILFDSVLQSNLEEVAVFLSKIIGVAFNELQLVDVTTKNHVRKYVGQPDTVLIDEIGKKIIFIEIKIGSKSTKYSLDQHLKYMTLNALTNNNEFYPEYQTYNILLADSTSFLENTTKLDQIDPAVGVNNTLSFNYAEVDFSSFRPEGSRNINSLINGRLAKITGQKNQEPINHSGSFKLQFFDWCSFFSLIPLGELKENLEPLMSYLSANHCIQGTLRAPDAERSQ